MTELEPLIKAFVKTLEEADIITTNTSDLTSTQFECFTPECLRVVMDSLDMGVSNTGRFHTNEELVAILRDATGSIQVVDACDLH